LETGVDSELLEDIGVQGILDKLIVIQSALFVSGAKGCGRVSSFTKQVIDARQVVMESDDDVGSKPRNLVTHFG